MKVLAFFMVLISIFSVIGCVKENDREEIQPNFYWEQTQCTDPWGTGANASNLETEAALKKYLNNNGIEVLEINFNNESELNANCDACSCGTGQRILISVTSEYETRMIALRFTRF